MTRDLGGISEIPLWYVLWFIKDLRCLNNRASGYGEMLDLHICLWSQRSFPLLSSFFSTFLLLYFSNFTQMKGIRNGSIQSISKWRWTLHKLALPEILLILSQNERNLLNWIRWRLVFSVSTCSLVLWSPIHILIDCTVKLLATIFQ